ncbi:MAG TPA: hypothetical protein VF017_07625 [Thermoanaerobaculia bacterium]|nr:hypothetical protein [Thermoanaerobaculia bacterium]
MVSLDRRERGQVLLVALFALLLLSTALALVALLVTEEQRAARREVGSLTLAALTDAALAESLARLAAGRSFPGLAERDFGGGTIRSELEWLGSERLEIRAHASWRGRVRSVRAEVDLTAGPPRVVSWRVLPRRDGGSP